LSPIFDKKSHKTPLTVSIRSKGIRGLIPSRRTDWPAEIHSVEIFTGGRFNHTFIVPITLPPDLGLPIPVRIFAVNPKYRRKIGETSSIHPGSTFSERIFPGLLTFPV
jgi:hypothetical protein